MKRNKSFTLVEILIVILIIGILGGIIIVRLSNTSFNAKAVTLQSQAKILTRTLDRYLSDVGVYPAMYFGALKESAYFTNQNGRPGWLGPYLDRAPGPATGGKWYIMSGNWAGSFTFSRNATPDFDYDGIANNSVIATVVDEGSGPFTKDVNLMLNIDTAIDDGNLETGRVRCFDNLGRTLSFYLAEGTIDDLSAWVQGNLAANGTFHNNGQDWALVRAGGASIPAVIESGGPNGSDVVYLNHTTSGWPVYDEWHAVGQDVRTYGYNFEAGKTYTVSFDYKTNATTLMGGSYLFRFGMTDPSTVMHSSTVTAFYPEEITNDNQWHTVTKTFTLTQAQIDSINSGYEPKFALFYEYQQYGQFRMANLTVKPQ